MPLGAPLPNAAPAPHGMPGPNGAPGQNGTPGPNGTPGSNTGGHQQVQGGEARNHGRPLNGVDREDPLFAGP
ncbi:hypothetical protein HUX53_26740 [Actinomadura sp. BRA 177]|nr:hypothetical protein [Actinomadura sp. BRA 177]